ncbi:MAG: T9SS type A sorting domain-containing protein, partial [Crocinitomicaceae bacterium]|nr:T9SS type A sorting domain-containing protein [Crocinitomicaceae bacterium]
FSATVNGDYAVEITQNGCTVTSDCYSINSVGIEPLDFTSDIRLFPNPAVDVVNIDFGSEAFMGNISLFTVAGELIQQHLVNGQTTKLNLRDVARGVYFIHVTSQGKTATFKVIKE